MIRQCAHTNMTFDWLTHTGLIFLMFILVFVVACLPSILCDSGEDGTAWSWRGRQ